MAADIPLTKEKLTLEVLTSETVREQLVRQGVHIALYTTRSLERTRQALLQLGAARLLHPSERTRLHKRFETLVPRNLEKELRLRGKR